MGVRLIRGERRVEWPFPLPLSLSLSLPTPFPSLSFLPPTCACALHSLQSPASASVPRPLPVSVPFLCVSLCLSVLCSVSVCALICVSGRVSASLSLCRFFVYDSNTGVVPPCAGRMQMFRIGRTGIPKPDSQSKVANTVTTSLTHLMHVNYHLSSTQTYDQIKRRMEQCQM